MTGRAAAGLLTVAMALFVAVGGSPARERGHDSTETLQEAAQKPTPPPEKPTPSPQKPEDKKPPGPGGDEPGGPRRARGTVTALGVDSISVKARDQEMKFSVDSKTV